MILGAKNRGNQAGKYLHSSMVPIHYSDLIKGCHLAALSTYRLISAGCCLGDHVCVLHKLSVSLELRQPNLPYLDLLISPQIMYTFIIFNSLTIGQVTCYFYNERNSLLGNVQQYGQSTQFLLLLEEQVKAAS